MKSIFSYDCIIPVCCPGDELFLLLYRLLLQTVRPNTIFLMHTEKPSYTSHDLRERLEKEAGLYAVPGVGRVDIRVISVPENEFDHGGTRLLATKFSHADFFLMMTQDAVPVNTSMAEHLLNAFDRPDMAVSYARQMPSSGANAIEKFSRQFNYPEESRIKSSDDFDELGIKTFFCSDVCAMYRADWFHKLGGFEKRIIFNEDMVYAAKAVDAGFSIAYCAEAKVVHSHSYSYFQQFKRNFDIGVSQRVYQWIFQTVSSKKEGLRFVRLALKHFFAEKEFLTIFDFIAESTVKFLGYRTGLYYENIPIRICKKLSMNKNYWKQ